LGKINNSVSSFNFYSSSSSSYSFAMPTYSLRHYDLPNLKSSCKQLFFLISFFTMIFVAALPIDKSQAWTYDDIWWFGASQSDNAANVRIVYTYPDKVQAGNQFSVGLTLEYLKENIVRSSWIIFSNVTLHLLSNDSASNVIGVVGSSESDTSKLIRAGEQYSHTFKLYAPESVKKYVLGLTLTAFFGPGSGSLESYNWDTRDHYNQTWREYGIIYPEDLSSIQVVKSEPRHEQLLVVELQKPYYQFEAVNMEINNIKKDEIEVDKIQYEVENEKVRIPMIDGKVSMELPANSSYSVRIPQFINMAEGIRAAFTRWSDGQEGYESNGYIERSVLLDNNTELFALFRTQFRLSVESNEGNTEGSGWYDSGSQANYAINPSIGLWTSFDYWIGDISAEADDIPSGHLTMNGPTNIKAIWKYDFNYITVAAGAIGGIAAAFEVFINKGRIRDFMHNFSHKGRSSKKEKIDKSEK
jgi:hypothetical protein